MRNAYYLPQAIGAALDNATKYSKRKAARSLFEAMGPMRKRVMVMMFEMIKDAATKDPDMLECIKAQIHVLVDGIAEDVELQTEEAFLQSQSSDVGALQEEPILPEPQRRRRRGGWCCSCCMRIRACILHHVIPHSKTVWGNFKDPYWWLFTIPSMVTAYNIRCFVWAFLLLLLVCPGPADQYQLTRYILVLKTNQFLTAGIGCMLLGSVEYYVCILFQHHELLECINTVTFSPFTLWFCMLDYLGSFVLPQLAMLAFYRAERLRPPVRQPSIESAPSRAADREDLMECCCCYVGHPAPSRLRMLSRYDMACFILSISMMLVLTMLAKRSGMKDLVCERSITKGCVQDPTLVLNAYWCKVIYAFTTLPFVFAWVPDFTPVSFSLITRHSRTGYNEEGQCVLFKMSTVQDRRRLRAQNGDYDTDTSSDESGSELTSHAADSQSDFTMPFQTRSAPPAQRPWGIDWRYLC